MNRKPPQLLPKQARGLGLSARVIRALTTCVHYTGLNKEHCAAGICYAVVRVKPPSQLRPVPIKYPCLDRHVHTCRMRKYPTVAEAEERVVQQDKGWTNAIVAWAAIMKYTKQQRKGFGGIQCPCCKTGELRYQFAKSNGHMLAQCSTPNCVHIIE